MSLQFKQDLFYEVTNDATVSGLISTRFYPGLAPQGATYPFVEFHTVSGNDELCHDGPLGIIRDRIQFDIVADTPDECEQIKDGFYTLLHGLSGQIGSGPTTTVSVCTFGNEMDFSEWEEGKHRKTIDFLISYK